MLPRPVSVRSNLAWDFRRFGRLYHKLTVMRLTCSSHVQMTASLFGNSRIVLPSKSTGAITLADIVSLRFFAVTADHRVAQLAEFSAAAELLRPNGNQLAWIIDLII